MIVRAADGSVVLAVGDVHAPVFPRSCNKPLQAVGMLRAGLAVPARELALVCASHSGTPMHVGLARSILRAAGLDETALRNAPGLPLDEISLRDHLAAGGTADAVHQNCSGKHAGMLATCVRNNWPLDDYRDPDHPLQRAIKTTVEELAGESVSAVGVDGCGAPLFALSLTALASAFHQLVMASPRSDEHEVAAAMRAHPDVVGGPGRVVTQLMTGVPGLLAKDGAEGAFVAALPDGGVVAVKIADGASRAASPVLVAGLRTAGVAAPVLAELASTPVLGGGQVVGEVRVRPGLCEATHIS
jgi:L-asparaginase II